MPADPRAGEERHEAERLRRRGVDHLPDVDPHLVAEHRHLVHQRDVHVAERVLEELRQSRRRGSTRRPSPCPRAARRTATAIAVASGVQPPTTLRRVPHPELGVARVDRARASTRAGSRSPARRPEPASSSGRTQRARWCPGRSSTRAPRAMPGRRCCATSRRGRLDEAQVGRVVRDGRRHADQDDARRRPTGSERVENVRLPLSMPDAEVARGLRPAPRVAGAQPSMRAASMSIPTTRKPSASAAACEREPDVALADDGDSAVRSRSVKSDDADCLRRLAGDLDLDLLGSAGLADPLVRVYAARLAAEPDLPGPRLLRVLLEAVLARGARLSSRRPPGRCGTASRC